MEPIRSTQIADGVWQLSDALDDRCYLVRGEERALLVDATSGLGDLRRAVAELCDLEPTVALTHFHYDHSGGARWFGRALVSPEDLPLVAGEASDAREAISTLRSRGLVGAGGPWAYDDAPETSLSVVHGGDVFDLGGLTVEAVRLPGHTAGSIGYLVRERRMLLSGDAVTPVMCLFSRESLTIAAYRATLARMAELPFDEFWTGHHAQGFAREELMGSFDACAAFAATDAGHPWQSSTIAGEVGTLHIFSGDDPNSPDFRAMITRREAAPRLRRRRRRGA